MVPTVHERRGTVQANRGKRFLSVDPMYSFNRFNSFTCNRGGCVRARVCACMAAL